MPVAEVQQKYTPLQNFLLGKLENALKSYRVLKELPVKDGKVKLPLDGSPAVEYTTIRKALDRTLFYCWIDAKELGLLEEYGGLAERYGFELKEQHD